jgi:sarcosine oxidase subunit delta
MLLIPCPNCGSRPEIEFRYGGEAHIARSADPEGLDDRAWSEFLFYRNNCRGLQAERWIHSHGCGRWFNAIRDTITDRFTLTYPMGQPRPDQTADQST